VLNKLIEYGDTITLVPQSGVQFVEYGFDLARTGSFSRSFIERPVSETRTSDGRVELQLLPNWNDLNPNDEPPFEAGNRDDEYSISKTRALDVFVNRWIPVPFLRIKHGRDVLKNETYVDGPTDWARVRVVETAKAHGDTAASHRVVFAFDTNLVEQRPNRPYLGLSPTDARQAESFRFVSRISDVSTFISNARQDEVGAKGQDDQGWLRKWLEDVFTAAKKAQYPNRPLRDDDFPHQFEHIALYLTFLGFLANCINPAKITLIDTVSEDPRSAPIDVDLVLDIGNARTCGLLIQNFPNDQSVDLNRSLVLELRDMAEPHLSYNDPFESQLELVHAEFGPEDLAMKSGRSKAFFWPSLVRLGPEAARYRSASEGTEAMTGLSSPKRYTWDVEPVLQSWRFRSASGEVSDRQPLIERSLYKLLNNRGDVLEQLAEDKRNLKLKILPEDFENADAFRFSRSSFFTFMMLEIISQTIMMINSPGSRRRDREKDAPRRLRSIVMTMPSATPVQEQRIIRSRAQAALKLFWSLMGWTETTPGVQKKLPELHTSWDEASSVQLVYLYGEISQKLGGSIKRLLDLMGKPRIRTDVNGKAIGTKPETSIRIASVDIGGGTTDLMVTTYHQIDNRALVPVQNFREGFRRAGDDLLKLVIERAVIPAIQGHMEKCGVGDARDILRDRFSDDSPRMDEADKHLRRQVVLRLLRPVALGILHLAEERSGHHNDMAVRPMVSFFKDAERFFDSSSPVLRYLEDPARSLATEPFNLADIQVPIDLNLVDECARAAFEQVFANIAEAIYKLDVDVVLLTGRPSCLPGVIRLFANQHCVPVDRLVPVRDYRVGNWYPFRQGARSLIDDPKTTAVVGGMLCSLADGQLTNFTLYTNGMSMRSTAKYIGEMSQDGVVLDEKLYFQDVDLDSSAAQHMEKEITFHTTVRIGYRQLAKENWTAAPLYKLRVRAGSQRIVTPPVLVSIERKALDVDEGADETAIMNSEATSEEFFIRTAEDASGKSVARLMELRLDMSTSGGDGIYWLDSGVLAIA